MNIEYQLAKRRWVHGDTKPSDLRQWSYLADAERLYRSNRNKDMELKETTCHLLDSGMRMYRVYSALRKRGVSEDKIPSVILCGLRIKQFRYDAIPWIGVSDTINRKEQNEKN